jgi:PAS domain-containing protein
MRLRITRRGWRGVAALAVAAVVLMSPPVGTGHAGAGLAVLVLGVGGSRSLRTLVAAIAAGTVVGGGLGWLAAELLGLAIAPNLAAGLGIAVGGGLGSVGWLLAVGEEAGSDTEQVTVDMEGSADVPDPEPADLFEASPDPILYYGGDGDLAVRAVNPAFGEVFGEQSVDLAGQSLEDTLGLAEGTAAVLEAAREGRPADQPLPCETAAGTETFQVRVAPTGAGDLTAGYVIYGPAAARD